MSKFNIVLADSVALFTGDNHKVAEIDTTRFTDAFVAEAFIKSLRIAAMNTYNGGGKDASAAEKQARLDKRLASWYKGEWAIVERGEGIMTAYKEEVFYPMALEQGMTLAAADKLIKEKVKEHFPPETKATFANYLNATAIESKGEFDGDQAAALEAIEAFYESELTERRAKQAKSASKIVAPKIDLAKFKKSK